MEICLLRLLNLLSDRGYFCRGTEDRSLLHSLEKQGFVEKKPGTKNIYLISDFGRVFLENNLYGREISLDEFYSIIKSSYEVHSSPMKPFVKINALKRDIIEKERISGAKLEEFLLLLHNQGLITLQSGLHSEIGGIANPNGGTFAYVMVEV